MAVNLGGFSIGDALNAIKEGKGYTNDKEIYGPLGVSKSTYSGWGSRNSLPADKAIALAVREDISLDWLYLGRNSMSGHIIVNHKTDEIARMMAVLDGSQKNALLGFLQSMVNTVPPRPPTPEAIVKAKLDIMDYLIAYMMKNCAPVKQAALEFNRNVGVITWIHEKQQDKFTVDELLHLAANVSLKEGKTISFSVE